MNFLKYIIVISLILLFMNCTHKSPEVYQVGVSHRLAKERKKQITDVVYSLRFDIPENIQDNIKGKLNISFELLSENRDVVLDFQNTADAVLSVLLNLKSCNYIVDNEHIIMPAKCCIPGKNTVTIEFIAGDASLNRHKDYLYTLFVPDKASIVFPCFDQPDIKAKYKLELNIPNKWTAMSNGKILTDSVISNKRCLVFDETKIISTYHFAFMAGKFQRLQRTRNGKTINFYHVEPNIAKVKANIDTLFDMHFMSLEWMEKYTGIKYPFKKFDFAAIPSFQFSGMEHVGAIFYRSSRMFLSKSASVDDIIKRATVIAHEVSHMWFGNLVTMKWFDDVWLKEVYAELFAAKMVHPMFPYMNHDLNFITANYSRAYQTDRTPGTHPIQQKLDNLKFAGTLYGDIIYYKAPIVMANLEQLIGAKAMQDGLREYLQTFSYGNAEWNDLIHILDKHTELDLNEWSKIWIMQEGMPIIATEIKYNHNKITNFSLFQKDSIGKNRIWKQRLDICLFKDGKYEEYPIYFDKEKMNIPELVGAEQPDCILLNGGAYGYGCFVLDTASIDFLLNNVNEISDDLIRTSAYINMFQAVVNYNLKPIPYIKAMMKALKHEKIKQNIQLLLKNIEITWWYFIEKNEQFDYAQNLESDLILIAEKNDDNEVKSAIFETLISVFISKNTQEYLYDIWKNTSNFKNLKLASTDYSKIALALSVRDYPNADSIVNKQLTSIDTEDGKTRFSFILPAASSDIKIRDSFFESLQNPKNRQHEVWVRSGLYYLHHPLRAEYSVKYLKKTLDMLEEIQKTGDIFFPKNWLAYSIGRYNTKEAYDIVNTFLDEHKDYNKNLKSKILQLSDYLFRANKMRDIRVLTNTSL